MKNKSAITAEVINHLSKLAKLPVDKNRFAKLQKDLETTFEYIDKIQDLDTRNIKETSQVTGQENVFREDVIDISRILSQEQVLSSAPDSHKGFIKVNAIFENE